MKGSNYALFKTWILVFRFCRSRPLQPVASQPAKVVVCAVQTGTKFNGIFFCFRVSGRQVQCITKHES